MEAPEKKPKTLIPKKWQLPAVAVGLALLAYFSWDTANRMGWIGGPPKAKAPVTAKQPEQPPSGGGQTQPAPAPSAPAAAPPRPGAARGTVAPNLDNLRAPARDPLTELTGAAAPPPAGGASAPPTAPPPAPIPSSGEAPPLPPPMPTPGGAQAGFPSPTVGPSTPGAVPAAVPAAAPAYRPVPAALSISYPRAHRGLRLEAAATPVTVLGTISGSRGSLAVVHPGEAARGQYVKPGDTVTGSGARVESIAPGTVTIGGRGGPRELSVRAHRGAPPAAPAAAPKPETSTESAPAPE